MSLYDDVKKEGDLMSVIIKRGTKIPITNTQYYFIFVKSKIQVRNVVKFGVIIPKSFLYCILICITGEFLF